MNLKACFLLPRTPGSFGTLHFLSNFMIQYVIGLLTLLLSLVQRDYFGFMANLSAPKSLLFVAMDSW